jgi:hypothetical protein
MRDRQNPTTTVRQFAARQTAASGFSIGIAPGQRELSPAAQKALSGMSITTVTATEETAALDAGLPGPYDLDKPACPQLQAPRPRHLPGCRNLTDGPAIAQFLSPGSSP